MARSNVPKFGNWENEDNVPYTVFFDKARKNKGGAKMINPNDPQQNPNMFPKIDPSPFAPPPKPKSRPNEPIIGRGAAVRPTTPEQNREGDFRQFGNSSVRSNESGGGGGGGGRGQRVERSPLHPDYYPAKVMGRGGNYNSAHANYGVRERLRPGRVGDESPEKGAAVPKFGDWNDSDPRSAENFTHIFNQVRNQRQNGTGNPSATPNYNYSTHSHPSNEPKKCCFPWW